MKDVQQWRGKLFFHHLRNKWLDYQEISKENSHIVGLRKKSLLVSRITRYAAACASVVGLAVIILYIYGVGTYDIRPFDIVFFWIAAIVFSAGLFLAWDLNENMNWYLALVLGVCAVFANRFFFRFYYFSADLVQELSAAQTTINLGKWPIQLIGEGIPFFSIHPLLSGPLQNSYYSTLSVTVFPAIISKTTGLTMIETFQVLIAITLMTTAVVIFLTARSIFNAKVGGLAALFYALFVPSAFLREDVAVLFFFMAVYFILKPRLDKANLAIAITCIILVPISHYGTFYFAIFGFMSLLLGRRILAHTSLRRFNQGFRQLENFPGVTGTLILIASVAGLAWLFFAAFPIIAYNTGELRTSLYGIFDLTTARASPFEQRVVFSSQGLLSTIASWAERILAVTGAVYVLILFKKPRSLIFAFFGLSMLFLVIVFAVVPNLADAIDLDRVSSYSLLAYTALIALVFTFLVGKHGNWTKLGGLILVTLFIFGILNFPILYSTYSETGPQQYAVTYTQLVTFYDHSDFQFTNWISVYTNQSATIATDATGYWLMYLSNRTSSQPTGNNATQILDLITGEDSDYVAILFYSPGFIRYSETNGTNVQLTTAQVSDLVNNSNLNLVYDNSKDVFFGHT